MENSSETAPITVQANTEDIREKVPLSSINSNGSDNSDELVSSQIMPLTSASSSTAATSNEDISEPEILESTPLATKLERVSAQLAVALQLLEKKVEENVNQKAKLREAVNTLLEQQMELDDKFGFDSEQEATNQSEHEQVSDLFRMQILASTEKNQKLVAKQKLEKMNGSLKGINEEQAEAISKFEKLFEEKQKHQKINFDKSLEEFTKNMQTQLEKNDEEQEEQIGELGKLLHSLTKRTNPHTGPKLTVQPDKTCAKRNTTGEPKCLSSEDCVKVVKTAERRKKNRMRGQQFVEEAPTDCESVGSSRKDATVEAVEVADKNSDDLN